MISEADTSIHIWCNDILLYPICNTHQQIGLGCNLILPGNSELDPELEVEYNCGYWKFCYLSNLDV